MAYRHNHNKNNNTYIYIYRKREREREYVKQQSKHVLVEKNIYLKNVPVRALSWSAWTAGFLQHAVRMINYVVPYASHFRACMRTHISSSSPRYLQLSLSLSVSAVEADLECLYIEIIHTQ